MKRLTTLAFAIAVSLLTVGCLTAQAGEKGKQHNNNGSKHHDNSHGRKHDHDKDHCDHCDHHHCGSGTQEHMGGSNYSPPGTPGNPVMPVKSTPPITPIKYYGAKNNLVALLPKPSKVLTSPSPPGGGGRGRIQLPPAARLPNANPSPPRLTGVLGFAVNDVGGGVYRVYSGFSGLVGEAGNVLGDVAAAITNFL